MVSLWWGSLNQKKMHKVIIAVREEGPDKEIIDDVIFYKDVIFLWI